MVGICDGGGMLGRQDGGVHGPVGSLTDIHYDRRRSHAETRGTCNMRYAPIRARSRNCQMYPARGRSSVIGTGACQTLPVDWCRTARAAVRPLIVIEQCAAKMKTILEALRLAIAGMVEKFTAHPMLDREDDGWVL